VLSFATKIGIAKHALAEYAQEIGWAAPKRHVESLSLRNRRDVNVIAPNIFERCSSSRFSLRVKMRKRRMPMRSPANQ
jgi:hypothetical protein